MAPLFNIKGEIVMKKILFLTIIMFAITTSVFAFSDVSKDGMYSVAINELVNKEIINGYEDNTFKPEKEIKRAELVKMMVIAKNVKEKTNINFTDVANDHWAKEYIEVAVANNYIKGYEDNTFKPEKNITYGEVATIIVRALGLEENAERLKISWPLNYMHIAEEIGLFEGYMTNDLIPENNARRDNVALMIWNMLKIEESQESGNEKNEENVTTEKVDTKTAHAGLVKSRKNRRAEEYVTVEELLGKIEYKLHSKSELPEINSFVIFQLSKENEMKIRKEIFVNDANKDSLTVKKVDKEMIEIEGKDNLLDLDMEEYKLGEEEIELDKYNYFILEIEEEEFISFELVPKTKLKLKENDKIKFETDLNVCYIFRDLSEE